LRFRFLRAFAWFGFAVSVVSFAAYFTSPGRVLWIFSSPYPDVWGPFLSRNDFAGFLELSLPVALWLALQEGGRSRPAQMPLWVPAWMLACGVASGSRAGAALLLAETAVILILLPRRRAAAWFGALAVIFTALTGAGALPGRLRDPDPLRYRREIANSTLQMIAERPWSGFGVGTYAQVYPAYAQFDSGAVVEHVHNYWLEWAAEGGAPLALVWAALAVGVCVPAFRSVWGLGIIAAFLHALVDYPFARFGLTAWNFALIGALSAAPVRKVSQRLHSSFGDQKENCS
jgi:O-antigen ligase